jgi:hypothetical protein
MIHHDEVKPPSEFENMVFGVFLDCWIHGGSWRGCGQRQQHTQGEPGNHTSLPSTLLRHLFLCTLHLKLIRTSVSLSFVSHSSKSVEPKFVLVATPIYGQKHR